MKSIVKYGLLASAAVNIPHGASAESPIQMDRVVISSTASSAAGKLETKTVNSGTTHFSAGSLETRTSGGLDANAALLALPMVQYGNDADSDAGQTVDDQLNLRPKEMSISGARSDENNIMIDGVAVNSIYGNESPLAGDIADQTGTLNLYGIYGLHSQSQFVPSTMLEQADVQDANVSAEYGGFQGGIVNYRLKQPEAHRASGSLSLSFSGDSLTRYNLATPNGTNPTKAAPPRVDKRSTALDINQPLGPHTALRFGFAREEAEGDKQRDAQYLERSAPVSTNSDFWRLGLSHMLDNDKELTLNAKYTDYSQAFVANWSRDYQVDVVNQGLALDAGYEQKWQQLDLLGLSLSEANLKLALQHQDNKVRNLSNQNVQNTWRGYGARYNRTTGELISLFESNNFDDFCDAGSAVPDWFPGVVQRNISCQTGGFGDRGYDDQRDRISADFDATLGNGRLKFGLAYESITAGRRAEASTVNSSITTRPDSARFASYECGDDTLTCLDDQFISGRNVVPGYEFSIKAERWQAYTELSQKFGALDLRFGLRADRNDKMQNLDIAPRLAGYWTVNDSFGISFGANRYYSDKFLTYAINDALPRGANQSRSADARGVVGDWRDGMTHSNYRYTQAGLDTPFNDEFTLGFDWQDRWSKGDWRLRYLQRKGRDQFARIEGGSSVTDNELTNDGWSDYQAVSLEYANRFDPEGLLGMDNLDLFASATWSKRKMANSSVFDSPDDQYYFYNDRSYSASEFDAALGNMDIPLKASVELRGSWQDEKYSLGLGADIRFGYDAAVDSGSNVQASHMDGYRGAHQLYEDRKMKPQVLLNLNARTRLYSQGDQALDLHVKVSNLLNETGNARATSSRPWVAGRSIWVGSTYTW